MEQYVVKWLRYVNKKPVIVDISARAGDISTTDDLDSLAVSMTLSVQQGVLDPYHKPLGLSCGDRILFYKDGALMLDGQIYSISGDYREKQTLTVYDDGVLLSKNDLIIQFNGASASQAVRQLCDRLGIPVGTLPDLPAKVTHLYHDSVSTILDGILDTVEAETGKRYFVRIRGGKLCLLQRASGGVVAARYRAADNLPAHLIQLATGSPSVKRSIEDLRNAVTIYSDQDSSVSVLATASDSASIERYGRRMKVDTYSDKDGATAAQKARTLLSALNRETEEITVRTFGADNVTAGVLLYFDLEEFKGTFMVSAVTKQYGHPYTMDMTLRRI